MRSMDGIAASMDTESISRFRASSSKRSLVRHPSVSPEYFRWENISWKDMLGIFAAIGAVLLILGCVVNVVTYSGDSLARETCLSPRCFELKEQFEKHMNFSADPCDDFYEYACGKWISEHKHLPNDVDSDGTWQSLENGILKELRNMLEGKASDAAGSGKSDLKDQLSGKPRDFYQSCMDEATINSNGILPVQKLLLQMGLLRSLEAKLAFMARWGMSTFISAQVEPDKLDSTTHAVYLTQTALMLPSRDDYNNVKSQGRVKALGTFIAKLVMLAQPVTFQASGDNYSARSQAVVELEEKVAKEMVSDARLRDLRKGWSHQKEVKDLDNGFNWQRFLDMIFKGNAVGKVRAGDSVQQVIIEDSSYFSAVSSILKTKDKRTIFDYLEARLLYFNAPRLDDRFQKAHLEFLTALRGITAQQERWLECTKRTNAAFGFALGAAFAIQQRLTNFSGKSDTLAWVMIRDIKDRFRLSLPNMDWMDSQAREQVKAKLTLMVENVGYPKRLITRKELERYYSSFHVDKNDYFWNEQRFNLFKWRDQRNRLQQKVDSHAFDLPPALPRADYSLSNNAITLTAGLMQPPLFHVDNLNAVNFGGLGTIVAHHVMHAFDDVGSWYDANGDMNGESRFSVEVGHEFSKRAKCLVEKYSQYKVDGQAIDGRMTLGENIADLGGLDAAFHAYKLHQGRVHQGLGEKKLPGSNQKLSELSAKQLFFVSFAISHCEVVRPETMSSRMSSDYKAPSRFRVIGSLSNHEPFAKVFKCKPGTPMNPPRPPECKIM